MILDDFFAFYLDRVKPDIKRRLLGLLPVGVEKCASGIAGMFRRDDPVALEFLLSFYCEMAAIRRDEPQSCIMFNNPCNVCFPFFIAYAFQHLPESIRENVRDYYGSWDIEVIVPQLKNDVEARNWFRENISRSLQQEHLFAMNEVISLLNFSSGGEYSFLNLVYPGVKEISGSILDAGCGTGFSSLIMSRHLDVVAVDACLTRLHRARGLATKMAEASEYEVARVLNLIETEMGEMSREKYYVNIEEILMRPQREIKFLNASLDKLPLDGPMFNGIVCLDVLEHTIDPGAVVLEFARLARPGAPVWVTVPNANGKFYQSMMENSRGATFPDMLHLHHWEVEELNRLFIDRGFEPIHVQPFDRLPSAEVNRIRAKHQGTENWPTSGDEDIFLQLFAVYRHL